MTLIRRFFVLQLLMLWQGGFLFYAAFVVPVGSEVLGSAFAQGRITRFVAQSLNWVGLAAVVVFAWESLSTRGSRPVKRWLWAAWLVMAAGLAALFAIRPKLLELVDFDASSFPDYSTFYFWHRVYLWIATFQWLAALAFAFGLLYAWRAADRRNDEEARR